MQLANRIAKAHYIIQCCHREFFIRIERRQVVEVDLVTRSVRAKAPIRALPKAQTPTHNVTHWAAAPEPTGKPAPKTVCSKIKISIAGHKNCWTKSAAAVVKQTAQRPSATIWNACWIGSDQTRTCARDLNQRDVDMVDRSHARGAA